MDKKRITMAQCKELIGHCWIVLSHAYESDKPTSRKCRHCGHKDVEVTTWKEELP